MNGFAAYIVAILVLLLLPTKNLLCQTPTVNISINKFTTEHGLPHSSVTGLAYDTTGTLWIATKGGLCSFDGDAFTTSQLSIRRNNIKELISDQNGMLWILAFRLDPQPDSIATLYIYNPYLDRLLSREELAAYHNFDKVEYSARELIKSTDGTIFVHNNSTYSYFYRGKDLNQIPTTTSAGLELKILSHETGITYFNRNDKSRLVLNYDLDTLTTLLEGEHRQDRYSQIESTYKYSTYYIRFLDSLYPKTVLKFDFQTEIAPRRITNLAYDKILFGVNNSLSSYDLRTQQITDYSDEIRSQSSTFNLINILQQDRHSFWLASYDGLYFVSESPNYFTSFLTDQHVQTRNIVEIGPDSLLVATDHGAYLVDMVGDTAEHLAVRNHSLFGIFRLEKNKYLIGMAGFSLYMLDLSTKKTDLFYNSDEYLVLYKAITLDDEIFVGTNQGIKLLTPDLDLVDLPYGVALESVLDLVVVDKSRFYALSNSGLYLVDVLTNEMTSFHDLKEYRTKCLYLDSRDTSILWIGTQHNGIIEYDLQEGIVRKLNTNNGLSNNAVHGIYADSLDRLWISTDDGINVLNSDRKEVIQLHKTAGFSTDEFNSYSSTQLKDGRIVFGSIDGIVVFNPEDFVFPESRGSIMMDKIVGKEKEVEIVVGLENTTIITLDRALKNKRLYLKDERSYFGQSHYKYIIPGHNSDWIYPPGNVIALPDFDYGRYQIIVSKKDNSSTWSKSTTFDILVPEPFYKTTLFLGLITTGFFLLVLTYLDRSRKSELKRSEAIQKRVDEQTLELAEKNNKLEQASRLSEQLFNIIGHDLRSPLLALQNINKSYNYLLKKKDHDSIQLLGTSIEQNANDLISVVNRLLDWSRSIRTRDIRLQHFTVSSVIEQVIIDLDTLLKSKRTRFYVEGDSQLTVVTEKESLVIIVRNIMLNAIKFSDENSLVNVSYGITNGQMVISVSDRGIGMTTAQVDFFMSSNNVMLHTSDSTNHHGQGLGVGLQICKHLISRLKGKISIGQNTHNGTIVNIKLPANQNY